MARLRHHLGVTGLFSDPHPEVAVPEGALSEANEVVIRRLGIVEPRPGFEEAASFLSLSGLWNLIPFDGSYLAVGSSAKTYWAGNAQVVDKDGNDPPWTRSSIRGCESRENLYLTTDDGVRRLLSSDDTTALLAGLVPPNIISARTSIAGSTVPNGSCVAYRATIELHLPSGLVITSAPSGRAVYRNDAGADREPVVRVCAQHLPVITDAKVFLKLYRTRTTTSPNPPDDLFLCRTRDVTGQTEQLATNLPDEVLDDDLGEKLYTSGSREGIERQNVRPPACKDLCLYNGSLVGANITRQARLTLRWTEHSDLSGTSSGIGPRTYTGTRTNGSANITGLSDTTGLEVGQVLQGTLTSWSGTGPVRITAINGTTLTMSSTWNGSTDGAPASLTFLDSICVGDPSVSTNYYRADSVRFLLEGTTVGTTSGRVVEASDFFVYAAGNASVAEDTTFQFETRQVVFEALKATTTLELRATNGGSYEPALPAMDEDALEVEPEHFPNGVAWSKTDQPEHFMLGAFQLAGHQNSPILRCIATRDAVWLLKGVGDGVYRFSGFGERSGFRIDKFDSSTYLLNAELACALGDQVFGWTNNGMCSISDGGIIPLSGPIRHLTRDMEARLTHEEDGPICLAVANVKDHEVIFGLPHVDDFDSELAGSVEGLWVYNVRTKAWTRWFDDEDNDNYPAISCAMYEPSTRLLYLGEADAGETRVERGPTEGDELEIIHADRNFTAITIATVLGNSITINGGSAWTPAVGDLLRRSTGYGVVTSVTSATAFTVAAGHGLTTGSSATAYEAFESSIAWLPKTSDGPATLKRFQEVITHWEDTWGLSTWTLVLDATRGFSDPEETDYTTTWARTTCPKDHRALIPRSKVLASRLYPKVTIRQADARWQISGITIGAESVSTRLNR